MSTTIVLIFWEFTPGGWNVDGATDYNAAYAPIARNVLSGQGWVYDDGYPAASTMPGFPSILVILFTFARWTSTTENIWVQLFTLLSTGISTILVFLIGRKFFDTKVAFVGACIWMTYPLNLWLTKQPNSELVFMPVLFGVFLLLATIVQKRSTSIGVVLSLGVLIGGTGLVRPNTTWLLVAVLLVLWIVLRREGWKRLALVSVFVIFGNTIMVFPWAAFSYHKTGEWFAWNNNAARNIWNGITCAVETKGFRQQKEISDDMRQVVQLAIEDRANGGFVVPGDAMSFYRSAWKLNPMGVIDLLLWKAQRAWYGTDRQDGEERYILALQVGYLFLAVLGGVVLWQRGLSGREYILIAGVLLFYFWGTTIMATSIVRYMVPVMPFVHLSAATGIVSLYERRKNKRQAQASANR